MDSLASSFLALKDSALKPIMLAGGVPMHTPDLYANNNTKGMLFRHDPWAAVQRLIERGADGLAVVAVPLALVTTRTPEKSWDTTPHFTNRDGSISYLFRDCVYEAADIVLEGDLRVQAWNSYSDILPVPPTDGRRWLREPHKGDGLLVLPLHLALQARKTA